MRPERLDRVEVLHDGGDLPWAARQALLDRFRRLDSMADVLKAFEDVGATRPVRLTAEQKSSLLHVIEFWSRQVSGGLDGLPEGVKELWDALYDDLEQLDLDDLVDTRDE